MPTQGSSNEQLVRVSYRVMVPQSWATQKRHILAHELSTYAGFGNHLARPLFRERHSPDMSEADATALIREGLEVSLLKKPKPWSRDL